MELINQLLLYRGCTTPVRLPAYEAATKAVLKKLGVEVLDLLGSTCCGAQYIESLSTKAYLALSGRILALAEREGKDIVALCGACSGSLKHNKHYLDQNEEARTEVNSLLADEGLVYSGKVKVKHLLEVFRDDIGYKAIGRAIINPYSGIKLAAHYGCHVTRPYEIVQVDDPENPTIIDKIIELAGATTVDYAGKTRCCGGPMLAMDEELANKIGIEKIENVRQYGAEGIVNACEFCDIQLTQVQLGGEFSKSEAIPIIPLPQFLGPAIGLSKDTLGFSLNRINPEKILATLAKSR